MKKLNLRAIALLLIAMFTLPAMSCEKTQAEKDKASLDEKIEKQLEYADETGTGAAVRKQIADILESNSKASFKAEKLRLVEISEELTEDELHAVLEVALEKKRVRLEEKKKKKNKELADAKNKVNTLAKTDVKKEEPEKIK